MTFEEIFDVPSGHTLKKTSYREKGHLGQKEEWKHEELNETGEVVARYKSWDETNVRGFKSNSGYEKYDLDGNVVATGSDLPL